MDAQLRADEAGADAESTRFLRERATHLEDALADLSHELRTSLNTILGVSRLMLGRPVAPDQREDLRLVVRAAEALLMTAESILRPFGQAMGTHPVADTKIALGLVLEDLARGFGSEAAAKNLLLRVEHDGELPVVSAGDAARLRQVLSNLMANAIKFTERGQVLVSLRAMKAEGRAACEMVVADTGMGIEPSRQQAIFRRFTQAGLCESARGSAHPGGCAMPIPARPAPVRPSRAAWPHLPLYDQCGFPDRPGNDRCIKRTSASIRLRLRFTASRAPRCARHLAAPLPRPVRSGW